MNIVGLGNAGCAIADALSRYPQYTIYKIDTGLEGDFDFIDGYDEEQRASKSFSLEEQDSPEDYESSTPSMKAFFCDIKDRMKLSL